MFFNRRYNLDTRVLTRTRSRLSWTARATVSTLPRVRENTEAPRLAGTGPRLATAVRSVKSQLFVALQIMRSLWDVETNLTTLWHYLFFSLSIFQPFNIIQVQEYWHMQYMLCPLCCLLLQLRSRSSAQVFRSCSQWRDNRKWFSQQMFHSVLCCRFFVEKFQRTSTRTNSFRISRSAGGFGTFDWWWILWRGWIGETIGHKYSNKKFKLL